MNQSENNQMSANNTSNAPGSNILHKHMIKSHPAGGEDVSSSDPASTRRKYVALSLAVSLLTILGAWLRLDAQVQYNVGRDSIAGHKAVFGEHGELQSWYKPDTPGAGYDHVLQLASEFIKDGVPVDSRTGEKMYFVTCCFQGPHMHDDSSAPNGLIAEDWMHNPACFFAGAVIGLAKGYRVYSGDEGYIEVVREMLDYQLENGTTPDGWVWAKVPYASADPFQRTYVGATRWESDGMRGDGLHGIEPDKVGELGYAYLVFYEITEDEKYLAAALNCADALSSHLRDIPGDLAPFTAAEIVQSPWPFRVNARTGEIISEYTSNVIEAIKLFDELLRIGKRIELDDQRIQAYENTRKRVWRWLYSKSGPMKTYIWNGYFEDIPNDPDRSNRVQITPLETARYLIQHPDLDPDIEYNVPALIRWVASVFGTEGMDAIKEQTWCYEPMGSHTARYASICAMWFEHTGDEWYREEASRFFNLATYMADENGVVRVGPNWPSSWFSDGYGDYIRHFMDGLGAVPEWAPAGEDHMLKSSSVIQQIKYDDRSIGYTSYDEQSVEILRLKNKPRAIYVGNNIIPEIEAGPGKPGWWWRQLEKGGILKISKSGGYEVSVELDN